MIEQGDNHSLKGLKGDSTSGQKTVGRLRERRHNSRWTGTQREAEASRTLGICCLMANPSMPDSIMYFLTLKQPLGQNTPGKALFSDTDPESGCQVTPAATG